MHDPLLAIDKHPLIIDVAPIDGPFVDQVWPTVLHLDTCVLWGDRRVLDADRQGRVIADQGESVKHCVTFASIQVLQVEFRVTEQLEDFVLIAHAGGLVVGDVH